MPLARAGDKITAKVDCVGGAENGVVIVLVMFFVRSADNSRRWSIAQMVIVLIFSNTILVEQSFCLIEM